MFSSGRFLLIRKENTAREKFTAWAKEVAWVVVVLKDGRVLQGVALHNPVQQTGSVLNAIDETRTYFSLEDIQFTDKVSDPRSSELSIAKDGITGDPL